MTVLRLRLDRAISEQMGWRETPGPVLDDIIAIVVASHREIRELDRLMYWRGFRRGFAFGFLHPIRTIRGERAR